MRETHWTMQNTTQNSPARSALLVVAIVLSAAAGAVGLETNAPVSTTQPHSKAVGESVVVLHGLVVVTKDVVTLADVADLEGPARAEAADWQISQSPAMGSSVTIDAQQLQRVLDLRGANLAMWVIRGSSSCKIIRPVSADVTYRDTSDAADKRRTLKTDLVGQVRDPDASSKGEKASRSFRDVVTADLQKRVADLGGKIEVQFPRVVTPYLELTEPTYRFEIDHKSSRRLGLVPVDVKVSGPRNEAQTLNLVLKVSLIKDVVVAANTLNRRQRIDADDLSFEKREFDSETTIGLSDTSRLVGQQAGRLIRKGELVVLSDVEAVPLVYRNDLVRVELRSEGLRIQMTAKALSTAGLGEKVELKNEMAGRRSQSFFGVVTGLERACVVLGSQPDRTQIAMAEARK